MLSRLLSLLLATTVFACPFLCRAGEADAPSEEKVDACSCCHHEEPTGDDSGESSDTGCQCVCAGAVVEHAASNYFDFNLQDSVMQFVVDVYASSQKSAETISERAELEPLDGMNCGRAMRCLYETFLC